MKGTTIMFYYFFVAFLLPCYKAQHDVASKMAQAIKGKIWKNEGIVQHTFEYATIPKRWGSAKLIEMDAEKSIATPSKCLQMVCLACGWKAAIPDQNKPETKFEGKERCLFMSVFTPHPDLPLPSSATSELLPVVFHIHHGQLLYGFKTEIGEVKNVVRQGIAVSNANFRLGAMGFWPHPDLHQVNAGQQDLILSLSWLQRHVRKVRGDPSQVAVTGSSSGAAQAMVLLASNAASGLFHKAWLVSMTSFGSPDFFSRDVNHVFETESKPKMYAIGCGTLDCMQETEPKALYGMLLDAGSALVQLSPAAVKQMPVHSFLAFDSLVVPNMMEAACTQNLANADLPVVVGQAKDELDTLKFQFPLRKVVLNLVEERTRGQANSLTGTCMQRRILNSQGLQENVEDFLMNLGGYLSGTRSHDYASGPRWHFLITAPASLSNRAVHTSAELLTWSPEEQEDTSQYHHFTKNLVMGNASPELRRYSHKNFLHFVRFGKPQDEGWLQTAKSQKDGGVNGLPSKLWDQVPLEGPLKWDHHHSNHSVKALYGIICNKPSHLPHDSTMDLMSCVDHPVQEVESPLEGLRQTLSAFKMTDLLFNMELVRIMKSPVNTDPIFKLEKGGK